jgi:hypothetical protein
VTCVSRPPERFERRTPELIGRTGRTYPRQHRTLLPIVLMSLVRFALREVLSASFGGVDRNACQHASDVRIDQEHVVGAPPTDSRHSGWLCQGLQGVHELAHACQSGTFARFPAIASDPARREVQRPN